MPPWLRVVLINLPWNPDTVSDTVLSESQGTSGHPPPRGIIRGIKVSESEVT